MTIPALAAELTYQSQPHNRETTMTKRMIDIGRQVHLTSMEARGIVEDCEERGVEIPDDVAATVASYFQSSGTSGRAMAALASGRPVGVEALLDDIATERRYAALGDFVELDMLATWAINHD